MTKLVFFGTEHFSLPFLQALVEAGYDIAGVVTRPDRRRGRSGQLQSPIVKDWAEQHSLTVLQPADMSNLAQPLSALGAKAAVLASYGQILPPAILAVFPSGIINVHPSDLPKHRGPSPIEQTILDGDTTTAVSLMRLVPAMDAGPVYAKADLSVGPRVDKPKLTSALIAAGVELLIKRLPAILDGRLEPIEQDHHQATYTKLIHKADGRIDWQRPAHSIERQIRAYQGWPGAFSHIFNVRITILEAEISDNQGPAGEHYISTDGRLAIFCGQGALVINQLLPAGKRPMASADFVRGHSG